MINLDRMLTRGMSLSGRERNCAFMNLGPPDKASGSRTGKGFANVSAASGFDFIDFWAVDFDWAPGKPFNHHWQDYRTRQDRSLRTVTDCAFSYPAAGTYLACVKVVDTFGCDTSAAVPVKM